MFNAYDSRRKRPSPTKTDVATLILATSVIFASAGSYPHEAFGIPSEPEVVDHVTIQHAGNGYAASYTLPIYQVGDIRFLSAGVGVEERKAAYPPFPLKLIFAQAGGAFLTSVSVTIQDSSGKEVLSIPQDRISGPWLFVDLPPGRYQVTAVRRDGTPVKRTIQVPKGKTKGIYLHWPAPQKQG